MFNAASEVISHLQEDDATLQKYLLIMVAEGTYTVLTGTMCIRWLVSVTAMTLRTYDSVLGIW